MADLPEYTDSDFQSEVLESAKPVFVDFWGPGCMPCQMIAPVIEELAAENADTVKFAKMNVVDCPQTAMKYAIDGVPTLMIFKDGDPVETFVGLRPKNVLQTAIDGLLA